MRHIYPHKKKIELYDEATPTKPAHGEPYLVVTQCRVLMERVIPKKNDNDGSNKDFVDVIYDKLMNANIHSVFDKNIIRMQKIHVTY